MVCARIVFLFVLEKYNGIYVYCIMRGEFSRSRVVLMRAENECRRMRESQTTRSDANTKITYLPLTRKHYQVYARGSRARARRGVYKMEKFLTEKLCAIIRAYARLSVCM